VLTGFVALFFALVLASFLAGLSFDSGFGFAAVLSAVIGATFAVGGFALLAAHALVSAGAVHSASFLALLLALLGSDGGVDGLFSFLVVASNHGKHSHSGHCGKQNFLHCVLMFWIN